MHRQTCNVSEKFSAPKTSTRIKCLRGPDQADGKGGMLPMCIHSTHAQSCLDFVPHVLLHGGDINFPMVKTKAK